jgi:hypothetical protein
MIQEGLNYIKIRIESRWPLIPLSAVIFLLRVLRFGHVWVEASLLVVFLFFAMILPLQQVEKGR